MCRTKKAAKVQTVSRQTELGDVVYAVGPQSLNETQNAKKDTTQTFHVDALEGKGLTWQFEMPTEGQRVDYKLDTGAQVKLLPYAIYQRLYPRPLLHPTLSRLFAYGAKSPIAVRGQCVCSVQLPQGELGNCDFMSCHRKWQRCRCWACTLVSNWD